MLIGCSLILPVISFSLFFPLLTFTTNSSSFYFNNYAMPPFCFKSFQDLSFKDKQLFPSLSSVFSFLYYTFRISIHKCHLESKCPLVVFCHQQEEYQPFLATFMFSSPGFYLPAQAYIELFS